MYFETVDGRPIEFAGKQLAVPGQDSFWPGRSRHLGENLGPINGRNSFSRPAFKIRFSAARYSFRASSSWSTIPVT